MSNASTDGSLTAPLGGAPVEVLDVGPVLRGLFPGNGLRRGSVLELVGRVGLTSLLFELVARALKEESWAAVVGVSSFGVEAAVGYALPLSRLVLVPQPGEAFLEATAVALSSCDLVVLCPPRRCSSREARRLSSLARAHGAVLVLVPSYSTVRLEFDLLNWPEVVDGKVEATAVRWSGLGLGHGTLASRTVELSGYGRRAGTRVRGIHCLLPGPDGKAHLSALASDTCECEVSEPQNEQAVLSIRAG